MNLLRWVSPQCIKEMFVPLRITCILIFSRNNSPIFVFMLERSDFPVLESEFHFVFLR
jgi:hypothetical protein